MYENLIAVAEECSLEARCNEDSLNIKLPHSPISLHFEKVSETTLFGAFYLRTNSWNWPGERSDLNDILSMLVAMFFAETGTASCALMDVPHPAAYVPSGEVYARYILLSQPSNGYFHVQGESFPEAEKLIHKLLLLEYFLHQAISPHLSQEELESLVDWEEIEVWGRRVMKVLGGLANESEDTYNIRNPPRWKYYRCAGADISIIQSDQVSDIFDFLWSIGERKLIQGVTGNIVLRDGLFNFTPSEDVDQLGFLLKKLAGVSDLGELRVMPLENCLVTASQGFVLFLGSSSGRRAFDGEKDRVFLRHQDEAQFLFPADSYVWAERVDGERFESLVYDLLVREPGVTKVRTVGHANERDGGRDHIAAWHTPPQAGGHAVGENYPIARAREVVIQCKALNRTVGKRHVLDIRDTLDQYDAEGYLLVAMGNVGTSAIGYLEALRRKGDYFTDWWGCSEIEHRLRRNPDIVKRYSDIVTVVSH
ncbi:hypothetical protein DPM19_00775 [Actinomadura craniellae]|uniref:Restriction endonuclease type IV Mrr domain-containing protein n=1 Tax=Actinomadura craniellae TaxID=2231787 RepID=A0A365HDR8_9ACTN|nr:restriction endonuclease [Actinomadura craniellae]RAY17270.1 hypothetical protein DPM19_00775 [Actinomadura craniellae]